MRKKILEKFRYTGFDGLSNVSVTVCTLETDTDLHESDEVDENEETFRYYGKS